MSAPGYCAEDVRVRQAMSTRKSDPAIAAAAGWSGRFSEPVAELVKRYTASVDFDQRLADADIAGSLAHARMLAAVGVLSAADLAAIERGLTDDCATRSGAAHFPGRPTSRTCTSISKSA